MRVLVVTIFALMTAACQPEQQDITGSTVACPVRTYSTYNPKDLSQCVNACKSCDHGTTVTCTTSCTLHGAR
jgi:hypothetical protein